MVDPGPAASDLSAPPPLIDLIPVPPFIVWDITYACPLRCSHCYSESGRRSSRQLAGPDLMRVTDALAEAAPVGVVLAGGEPFMVRDLAAVVRRLSAAGIQVTLYTGGWGLSAARAESVMDGLTRVVVSLDGASAGVHDRIRGRTGSFAQALGALAHLDGLIAARRTQGKPAPILGVDFVAMRSNFHELRDFCSDIAPQFPQLTSISFGAVIPTGLASRPTFAARELLDEAQLAALAGSELRRELRSLAPTGLEVRTSDNAMFQMRPDLIAAGMDIPPLQIEPDGQARIMPVYEGVVGSLLDEPLAVLWARAVSAWDDPFRVEALREARSMVEWAEATRRIDLRFGTDDDRERIARRRQYPDG